LRFGGTFGGIYLFPVQNLASYSCSAAPISDKVDEILRPSEYISVIFRDLMRNRQTRQPLQKALTLIPRVCEPNKTFLAVYYFGLHIILSTDAIADLYTLVYRSLNVDYMLA